MVRYSGGGGDTGSRGVRGILGTVALSTLEEIPANGKPAIGADLPCNEKN
jgi:hypothetical protein